MQETFADELMLQGEIINKINDLYITERKKYLILNDKGEYSTCTMPPLNDSHIIKHIEHEATFGVFSGKYFSKFLCFDLDIVDKKKLKWVYYLLMNTLSEIGLDDKYIHVASSGNKGYHVLLFIKNGTSIKNLIDLFDITMKKIKESLSDYIHFIVHSDKEYYGEFDFCQIELRPTNSQGVKVELGSNFRNSDNKSNKCYFLDKNTLKPIEDYTYLLNIEPMDKRILEDILSRLKDKHFEDMIKDEVVEIKSTLKEPHSHRINKNEDETIRHILDIIQNGLQMEGTRHNSCLKISKYLRYSDYELDEAITILKQWMSEQDKQYIILH